MSVLPSDEERKFEEESEQTRRVEPLFYKWLGEPVIINYSRGPSWFELEDPYEVARGAVEGREALFFLEEAGVQGVGVRRILKGDDNGEELGALLWLPWSAIHTMFSALPEDEEEQTDESGQTQSSNET